MDDVGARWLAAMRRGDFEAAWRQTDRVELPRRQLQLQPGFVREDHHLYWDGTPFAGRSVRVRCEHGLGDTLQFIRFVPAIAAQARELHLMVQPPLLALLQGAPGLGQVHDAWAGPDTWPDCEVDIEVMELAYALRCTLAQLPPPYPHLPARVRGRLDLQLPRDEVLNVGMLWAASDWDRERSLQLAALAPLFDVAGVRWFSLQQGEPARDAGLRGFALEPLSARTQEICDAAAAMLQLDLVVCVDGMPAHLAAMLGRPTWLLLKHEADWRWMSEGQTSPWYPTMRLFRQPRPGDWDALVQDVAAALAVTAEYRRQTTAASRSRRHARCGGCVQSSPMKNNRKAAVLVAALAAVAGTLGLLAWQWPALMNPSQRPSAAAPGAAPAQSAASGAQAGGPVAANEPVEEVHESPDTETPLERIIPRQSNGHAQGLNQRTDPLKLDASVALVMDAKQGKVLYAKNEEAVLPIASVTKLMTSVVLLDAKLKMDEVITITDEDVDTERHSRSRLKVGTTLTRDEALHLALMSSENRAAHALGRTYPGGLPAFVKAMNAKAQVLGMAHTHYVDPTGLSSDNQSTAHDLALLVAAASNYPLMRQYSTTPQYLTAIGKRMLRYNNSNRLVKDPRWDIGLQKTGYIIEAGHCVVMRTGVAGKDVVMVLLDAGSNSRRNADAERLRLWMGGDPPRKAVAKAEPKKNEAKKTAARKAEPKAKAVAKADKRESKAQAQAPAKGATETAQAAPGKGKRVSVTLPGPKMAQAPAQGSKDKGHKARGDDDG